MAIAEPSTGDAPEIEDGLYELTCVNVSDPFEEKDFAGTKMIKKVRIFMQVHGTDDGEGNEVVLDPKVNLKWSPGGDYPASTLYLYATALCGPQDPDIAFDTDNLKRKSAKGMIKTEAGKWPRIEPKSLLPIKKGKATASAIEDVPFDTEPPLRDALADAAALATIVDEAKKIGFSMKEITDVCQSEFNKPMKELTAEERERFRKALGV